MQRTPQPHQPEFWTNRDFKVGDRVKVTISGRAGTIVSRRSPSYDGWNVEWDEPMFGVTVGRVASANMEKM